MIYKEVAIGSTNVRNILMLKSEIPNKVKTLDNSSEMYMSVYDYDKDIIEHIQVYKTVRSFRGKYYINEIVLDVDKKTDTDEYVLDRARIMVESLKQKYDLYDQEIQPYYSGRGYHIVIPDYFRFTPSEYLPNEVRNTIKEYFPEVDPSIYIKTGLIRVPNSINVKSSKYKIPLTVRELYSLEAKDIIELALKPRYDFESEFTAMNRDWHSDIIKDNVERTRVEYRDSATRVVTCMQHLYSKGSSEGSRHIEGMRLISTWRVQGLTQSACIELLKSWAPTLNSYEIERMVKDVYDKGYRYGCSDTVMSKYCDPKCIYYTHKNYMINVAMPNDIDEIMSNLVKKLPSVKRINLKDIFELENDYNIYEGEMVVFWGDTKIGKSTLVQNIITNIPDKKILYMSLENGITLDARRLLQIKLDKTKDEIFQMVISNSSLFANNFRNVYMIENTIDVDDIPKFIADSECDILVIDTMDQLKVGKETDYTRKTQEIALRLRDISRNTKVIMFIVHHISKSSALSSEGFSKSMNIHSGKGSSALEQKADKVISIEGERDGEIRIIRSQGARDENPFMKTIAFNKNTFKFYNITER
jgi:archaellum biogenesis ATPase FlaH